MKTRLFVMAVAGLLTACGGGGGDSSPAQPTITASAEGQFIGTTNANQAVTATILDNGSTMRSTRQQATQASSLAW